MIGLIKTYWKKYQEYKRKQAEGIIANLKARYHTFRVLLISNDQALKTLNDIDMKLKRKSISGLDLATQTEELLGTTYELVDGLNLLSGNRHTKLYELHKHLSDAVRKALPETSDPDCVQPYCLFLDDIMPDMKPLAGGKAGPLTDLKRISVPVPDGFVITTHASQEFLKSNDLERPIRLMLHTLEEHDPLSVNIDKTVTDITRMIESANLSPELETAFREAYDRLTGGIKPISVRSSAGVEDQSSHSFAGQFKTVLNVTSFDSMVKAFKEVLSSNFNAGSLIYRFHAGLSLVDFDMAVLCQVIVDARTAGVLFTVDPDEEKKDRMLLSAVAGMGSTAVGGEVPSDLYHPLRDGVEDDIPCEIPEKTYMEICDPEGGILQVDVPEHEKTVPLLTKADIMTLRSLGLVIESFTGKPQDIEWAIGQDGSPYILQSRPFRRSAKRARTGTEVPLGDVRFQGGVASSPGRSIGKVKIIHSTRELEGLEPASIIAVLHQSLVEAARMIHNFTGIVVDKGNPVDHLSNLAREFGIPMITRAANATRMLQDGEWVVLDADHGTLFKAPDSAIQSLPVKTTFSPKQVQATPQKWRHFRELIVPLNLTDAYGPDFSILECRSVHDLIRYVHEMAVMTMFNAGDEVLEGPGNFIHRLEGDINFHFLIIDMGGGLTPGIHKMKITPPEISSKPLLSLWKGACTPGLRWNAPPPAQSLTGLFSRSITDNKSMRPIGNCNYALIARDYLNLNARLEFHFTMIDTVCGRNPKDNYVRFRFKGGGTSQVQRERRAHFIAEVLESHDFFTDLKGDLVTGTILEMTQDLVTEKLDMLGRLLGFSRLMDSMMHDDDSPAILAAAFREGNYSLEGVEVGNENIHA